MQPASLETGFNRSCARFQQSFMNADYLPDAEEIRAVITRAQRIRDHAIECLRRADAVFAGTEFHMHQPPEFPLETLTIAIHHSRFGSSPEA